VIYVARLTRGSERRIQHALPLFRHSKPYLDCLWKEITDCDDSKKLEAECTECRSHLNSRRMSGHLQILPSVEQPTKPNNQDGDPVRVVHYQPQAHSFLIENENFGVSFFSIPTPSLPKRWILNGDVQPWTLSRSSPPSFTLTSVTEPSVCTFNRQFHTYIGDLTVPVCDSSLRNLLVPVSAPHRRKSFGVLSRRFEWVQRPSWLICRY